MIPTCALHDLLEEAEPHVREQPDRCLSGWAGGGMTSTAKGLEHVLELFQIMAVALVTRPYLFVKMQ